MQSVLGFFFLLPFNFPLWQSGPRPYVDFIRLQRATLLLSPGVSLTFQVLLKVATVFPLVSDVILVQLSRYDRDGYKTIIWENIKDGTSFKTLHHYGSHEQPCLQFLFFYSIIVTLRNRLTYSGQPKEDVLLSSGLQPKTSHRHRASGKEVRLKHNLKAILSLQGES